MSVDHALRLLDKILDLSRTDPHQTLRIANITQFCKEAMATLSDRPREGCGHDWQTGTNPVVGEVTICTKCHAVKELVATPAEDSPQKCGACWGEGYTVEHDSYGQPNGQTQCPDCNGTGRQDTQKGEDE